MTIEVDVSLFVDLAAGNILVEHDNRTAERIPLADLVATEARRVLQEPGEIPGTLAGLKGLVDMLSHTVCQLEALQTTQVAA